MRNGRGTCEGSAPRLYQNNKLLSPDEAVLICELKTRDLNRVWTKQLDIERKWWFAAVDELTRYSTDNFSFPANYKFYVDHLEGIGLIENY